MSAKQEMIDAVNKFRNHLMAESTSFRSMTHDNVLRSLHSARRVGNTSTLAGVLKINPNATLLVGNRRMVDDVTKTHGICTTRVHSAESFSQNPGFLYWVNGPVLFDTTAIETILHNIRNEVQNG